MKISKQQLNEVSSIIVEMMQLDMPVESARKAADLCIKAQDILIAVWDDSDPQPLPGSVAEMVLAYLKVL
jgi:hypothetical protein